MFTDERYGRRIGETLRQELADLNAPPDLLARLHRRRTRRTWTVRIAIATPVAAATAATAVVLATAGQSVPPAQQQQAAGSTTPPAPQVETVAYVQAQTLKAVSQADQYVIFARNSYDDEHYDEWTDRATNRYRNDVYNRNQLIPPGTPQPPPGTPPGPVHLTQSHSVSGPADHRTIFTIDWDHRTWWTGPQPPEGPAEVPDITDPDGIRAAISNGTLELLGRETVDGHDTLHLRLFGPNREYRIDMWVDGKTYLPVRETSAKGGPEFPPEGMVTATYTWLPRTGENLAKLELTPPPGFKQGR